MTTIQLFFALAGLFVTVFGGFAALLKYYIDAKIDGLDGKLGTKIDGIAKQVDLLVHYMIDHSERIAKLEERTK